LDDLGFAGIKCDFIFIETDLNRFPGRQFLNDDFVVGFFNKAQSVNFRCQIHLNLAEGRMGFFEISV
jgi:hypothetical protein